LQKKCFAGRVLSGIQIFRYLQAGFRPKIDKRAFRESLAAQIALVAGKSVALGYQLEASNTPVMSKNTAFEQLAQSAALLRGVLISLDIPVSE